MGKGKQGQGLISRVGDGICCEKSVEFARSRDQVSGNFEQNAKHSSQASGSSSRDWGGSRDKQQEQFALKEMDELLNRMQEEDFSADGCRFCASGRNSRGEGDEAKNNVPASVCEKNALKSSESGHDSVIYSAPQHCGWRDAATVFCVAGILVPVFTVFPLVIYYSWYQAAYAHYLGGPVLTSVILYIALASAMWTPAAYSETFKKVLLRPIMFELLSYVKGFKVLKQEKLASDKNYIFCWHPHGRLFYGFATFCGLFDSIVCPELGNAELFGGINDLMFSLPVVGVLLRLSGEMLRQIQSVPSSPPHPLAETVHVYCAPRALHFPPSSPCKTSSRETYHGRDDTVRTKACRQEVARGPQCRADHRRSRRGARGHLC